MENEALIPRHPGAPPQHGGRITTVRRLVVTALVEADGHVTAEELEP